MKEGRNEAKGRIERSTGDLCDAVTCISICILRFSIASRHGRHLAHVVQFCKDHPSRPIHI